MELTREETEHGIDLDTELKRVINEMHEAEDNLIDFGFPETSRP